MEIRARISSAGDSLRGDAQKILHSFRRGLAEQSDDYSARWVVVDHDVEVDLIGNFERSCLNMEK